MKKNILFVGLIFLVTFILYANSFRNKFVYDDVPLIVENKSLSWNNLSKIFSSDMWAGTTALERQPYYRPLPMASLLIDKSLWNLKPYGYHIINTFFHAANGTLVFFICNYFFANCYMAAAAALLFVTHPAQTESVAFISSRGEVLFLFFLLATIYLFIRNKTFFPVITFLFALLSKESALITPVLLFLAVFYFGKEKIKYIRFIPFIAVITLYLLLRTALLPPIEYSGTVFNSLNRFIYSMTRGAMIYMKIFFIPINLFVLYDINPQVSVFEFMSVFSIILTFILIFVAYLTRKKIKIISFSIFWFYAGLIPASHILYRLPYLIAERQLYLPSVGFCILAGWVLLNIFERYRKTAIALFVIIILLFSGRTINRNFDWGDEKLLWGGVLKHFPDSSNAHMNLGIAYADDGDYQKAEEHYKETLKSAYFNYPEFIGLKLADAYKKMNRLDLALDEYKKIIKLNAAKKGIHNSIGNIYLRMGKTDEALKEFFDETSINPCEAGVYINIGSLYAIKKRYSLAEKYYKYALQIDPSNESAKTNLLLLYSEMPK